MRPRGLLSNTAGKKPPKVSRGTKAVISEDEHKKLLEAADEDFRDLLVLLWNTGARPSEVSSLTAEQVNAVMKKRLEYERMISVKAGDFKIPAQP